MELLPYLEESEEEITRLLSDILDKWNRWVGCCGDGTGGSCRGCDRCQLEERIKQAVQDQRVRKLLPRLTMAVYGDLTPSDLIVVKYPRSIGRKKLQTFINEWNVNLKKSLPIPPPRVVFIRDDLQLERLTDRQFRDLNLMRVP